MTRRAGHNVRRDENAISIFEDTHVFTLTRRGHNEGENISSPLPISEEVFGPVYDSLNFSPLIREVGRYKQLIRGYGLVNEQPGQRAERYTMSLIGYQRLESENSPWHPSTSLRQRML